MSELVKYPANRERPQSSKGQRIVAGLVTACLTLTGCSQERLPDSLRTDTILATPNPTRSSQMTIDILRIHTPGQEDKVAVSDGLIEHTVKEADRSLWFNLQGTSPRLSIGTIDDKQFPISNFEIDGHTKCYTNKDLAEIEKYAKNKSPDGSVAIILSGADLCKTRTDTIAAAAYAREDLMVFAQQSPGQTYFGTELLLHESMHTKKMNRVSHEAKLVCDSPDFPNGREDYSPTFTPFSASSGCRPMRNKDGTLDMYASNRTIMSGRREVNSNSPDTITSTSFSTIDRKIASPDSFNIAPANLVINSSYNLSAEKNHLNGIYIPIPEDHPLKAINPSIDRLVVAAELDYGNPSSTEYSQWSNCEDTACDISLTATNADYGFRMQVENLNYPLEKIPEDNSVIYYVDEHLNISVLAKFSKSGVQVKLIDSKTGIDIVEQNLAKRQARLVSG